MSPTITTPAMTQAGMILGTAAWHREQRQVYRGRDDRLCVRRLRHVAALHLGRLRKKSGIGTLRYCQAGGPAALHVLRNAGQCSARRRAAQGPERWRPLNRSRVIRSLVRRRCVSGAVREDVCRSSRHLPITGVGAENDDSGCQGLRETTV